MLLDDPKGLLLLLTTRVSQQSHILTTQSTPHLNILKSFSLPLVMTGFHLVNLLPTENPMEEAHSPGGQSPARDPTALAPLLVSISGAANRMRLAPTEQCPVYIERTAQCISVQTFL